MSENKLFSSRNFLFTLVLVIVIVIVSIGSHERWWDLRALVEPFYLGHLLGIIGAEVVPEIWTGC